MDKILEIIDSRILELTKSSKHDENVFRMEELIALKAKLVEMEKSNADK